VKAYHVTSKANWQEIQNTGIRSYDRLVEDGETPAWKWDEAPEGHDGYWISLFKADQLEEAEWFIEDYMTDAIIIELELPEAKDADYEGLRYGQNSEGYFSIAHHIPARFIVGTKE